MGTGLALVSSRSQIRQPEGKSTLTTVSPISASQPRPGRGQPRTPPGRAPAAGWASVRHRSQNSTLLRISI